MAWTKNQKKLFKAKLNRISKNKSQGKAQLIAGILHFLLNNPEIDDDKFAKALFAVLRTVAQPERTDEVELPDPLSRREE